ncbi:hypothetical protein BT96DRAFT_255803 [Gymnopus androsaceus JB14]|uniref:Uncharacterized protein n=1 Tax=Gymnopus androsaceus JB14 TaxID=1447944 RepID=A0A6A4H4L4_9AGAR|nr:hypothetical protein BT96DRAFT_255803 [Gymnopus androsaceus JB14]
MSFYSSGMFNPYASKKQNSSVGVDFSYLNTADDVVAPTSDEFDSELDALIESIDIDQLTAPTTTAITNPFQFRSSQFDNSFSCAQGPASAFTFSSSESSYDSRSVSGRSQSSYNAYSPRDTTSNYSFPLDLDTEFQRFAVDGEAALDLSGLDCVNSTTFNMPTEPKRYNHRSSFSDYGPSTGARRRAWKA